MQGTGLLLQDPELKLLQLCFKSFPAPQPSLEGIGSGGASREGMIRTIGRDLGEIQAQDLDGVNGAESLQVSHDNYGLISLYNYQLTPAVAYHTFKVVLG